MHNAIATTGTKQHWKTLQKEQKSNIFTAGLALLLVRGKRRVPAPPPKMIEATLFGSAFGVSK